jgi:hypothetical protein
VGTFGSNSCFRSPRPFEKPDIKASGLSGFIETELKNDTSERTLLRKPSHS